MRESLFMQKFVPKVLYFKNSGVIQKIKEVGGQKGKEKGGKRDFTPKIKKSGNVRNVSPNFLISIVTLYSTTFIF